MSNIFDVRNILPGTPTADSAKTEPRMANFLGRVMDVCLHAVVLFLPLFFSTWTLDALELNKQTLLVVLASIAGIAWIGKALAEKRIALSHSWLHLVVVLFGLGYLGISWFSQNRYVTFVGSQGQAGWAFATIAALVVLYVVAVNRIRTTTEVYNLVFTFLASSLLVGVYGLLQLFGWFVLPDPFTHNRVFTTVGSIYNLAIYLVPGLVIASALAFHGCRNHVCVLGEAHPLGRVTTALVWATIAVSLALLVLIDLQAVWFLLAFGTLLMTVIGLVRSRKVHHPFKLALPVVLLGVSVALFFLQTPFNLSLPSEVSPSPMASWAVARETLGAHPLFGSGPGTWIEDYARYRVQFVNQSPFWNTRFDRGYSSFLTALATLGIVGTSLWLLLLISAAAKSATHLLRERDDDEWYAFLIVFSGWAVTAVSAFVYNFGVSQQFVFWFLLALLGSLVAKEYFVWEGRKNAWLPGVLSLALAVGGIAAVSVIWLSGQRLIAEIDFSKAVSMFRASQPIEAVLAKLDRAQALNPWTDVYARNLSQAHLIRVSTLVQGKPTQAQLSEVPSEVTLAAKSGVDARNLAPTNVDNWANMGALYESVAGFTQNADQSAIDAFQAAHDLEPQNPAFPTEIGKLYLLRADANRGQLDAKDATVRANAQTQMTMNLTQAASALRSAINTKSDYFPAHYFLGVVYERQGSLAQAIAELEGVLAANNKDVGVAFELAILYYRNNNKDRALTLMEQVVKANGNDANARWYLSTMYEERNRLDDAIAQITALAAQLPDNSAVAQRLSVLRQEANAAKHAPTVSPLPEPLPENVHGPSDNNPIVK